MAPKRPSGDLLDLLRRYLREQTVDPLRAAGRFLLFGVSGALLIGVGVVMLAVGGLRLLQGTEMLDGSWSWAPYLLVAAGLGCVVALSVTRIGGGRGLDS
ncbi:MAG: hypothetical protein QF896_02810 [Acidimicrobiales bacterium]|jgi:hypothetical protein|nr:hypothetical protein [Acidimicrobiales bacterium]